MSAVGLCSCSRGHYGDTVGVPRACSSVSRKPQVTQPTQPTLLSFYCIWLTLSSFQYSVGYTWQIDDRLDGEKALQYMSGLSHYSRPEKGSRPSAPVFSVTTPDFVDVFFWERLITARETLPVSCFIQICAQQPTNTTETVAKITLCFCFTDQGGFCSFNTQTLRNIGHGPTTYPLSSLSVSSCLSERIPPLSILWKSLPHHHSALKPKPDSPHSHRTHLWSSTTQLWELTQ